MSVNKMNYTQNLPVKLKFNGGNVIINDEELLSILREKYKSLNRDQINSLYTYINDQFRRGNQTLKRFISNLINKSSPPNEINEIKKLINKAKVEINVKKLLNGFKRVDNTSPYEISNLVDIIQKRTGIKIHGRYYRSKAKNKYISVTREFIKELKPLLAGTSKQNTNINDSRQIYKIFNELTNGLINEQIAKYRRELSMMNETQLLKELSKEFKLSNHFILTYNSRDPEKKQRLYNSLLEILEDSHKYHTSRRGNNGPTEIVLFRQFIRSNNTSTADVLKFFFQIYLQYIKTFLNNKKFFGYPPTYRSVKNSKKQIPFNSKEIRINERAFPKKNLLSNNNTNANNNTPSKKATKTLRKIKIDRLSKKFRPNTQYTTESNINTGESRLDHKTMVAFLILIWMDMIHDFKGAKIVPDDFFEIIRNEPNLHFISIFFPQLLTNRRNLRVDFFKQKMDHPIISKLILEKILVYKDNAGIPSLKCSSNFEDKIKNKFGELLGISGSYHQVSTAQEKQNLSRLGVAISIDAERTSKSTYRQFEHITYLPIERVFDPGITFSPNVNLPNLLKRLISPSDRKTIPDFRIRTYTLKFENFNNIIIKLVSKNGKPLVRISSGAKNTFLSTHKSKNSAKSNGRPEDLLSKTFGDYMQILAIAARSDNNARVWFGTFDAMAAFIYAFTRKYIFNKRSINLLYEIGSLELAAFR